ncbi:MAG: nuclear transport factor 2 family protein [Cyclobacteriaceae bacterium]|nr:nuclear transport factor 2 family protein [Cyclobacteriaceae bacterium]
MKKKLFAYFLLFFGSFAAFCQSSLVPSSEEQKIERVIREVFDGYKAGDSTRVGDLFTKDAVLQTAFYNKEGKSQLSELMPVSKFLSYIGSGLQKVHDERIWNLSVKVDNNLASAWTNYAFYLNGQFLHCGAENFLLIQTSEGWKIFHLVDTRQQTGCSVPDFIKNQ